MASRMLSTESRPETFEAETMTTIGARSIFTDEHDQFRTSVRRFWQERVAPHHAKWEAAGQVPRELWQEAGKASLLGVTVPTEYNGLGLDVLYAAIGWGEQHLSGCTGPGFALHAEIVAPYIMHYGSEAQKKYFLPPMVAGDMITAIAMTEPGAGSDLQGMKTTARVEGGDLVLNGSKTYITNGVLADTVIVCARTDPNVKAAKGISLLLVETSMKGFKKGRRLDKIGLKAQDTSELYFDDVRVPIKTHLLGPLNRGFVMLMEQLPQERMMIAEMGVSAAEAVFEHTRKWCKERMAFGKPLVANQVVAHKLAKMKIDIVQTRLFVDKCLLLLSQGKLDAPTACMAKVAASDLQNRIADEGVQLHGGHGFMADDFIGRAFVDARVQRIYGGSNEVLIDVVARTL